MPKLKREKREFERKFHVDRKLFFLPDSFKWEHTDNIANEVHKQQEVTLCAVN